MEREAEESEVLCENEWGGGVGGGGVFVFFPQRALPCFLLLGSFTVPLYT